MTTAIADSIMASLPEKEKVAHGIYRATSFIPLFATLHGVSKTGSSASHTYGEISIQLLSAIATVEIQSIHQDDAGKEPIEVLSWLDPVADGVYELRLFVRRGTITADFIQRSDKPLGKFVARHKRPLPIA